MRTVDRQQIGLRVVQELVNELRNLLAIADQGGEVRRELAYDASTIHDRRGYGGR
jgi:hypothetical protein